MRNRTIQNLILTLLVGEALLLTPLSVNANAAVPAVTQGWDSSCPFNWTRDLFLRSPNMTGKDVRELQRRLNLVFGPGTLEVDGVFGPRTRAAVVEFQEIVFLEPDGIVGPKTQNILNKVCVQQNQ